MQSPKPEQSKKGNPAIWLLSNHQENTIAAVGEFRNSPAHQERGLYAVVLFWRDQWLTESRN